MDAISPKGWVFLSDQRGGGMSDRFLVWYVPLSSNRKMLNPNNDIFGKNDPDFCRKVYGRSFVKFS